VTRGELSASVELDLEQIFTLACGSIFAAIVMLSIFGFVGNIELT